MDTQNKLLDMARKMCERDSDNALSIKLGVTRSAVSKWRHGGKIDDAQLAAVIELAKADPATFVQVRTEEATSPAERRVWKPLWDRLSAAAAVVALVSLSAGGLAAKSAYQSTAYAAEKSHSLYIMFARWLRRFWRSPASHASVITLERTWTADRMPA